MAQFDSHKSSGFVDSVEGGRLNRLREALYVNANAMCGRLEKEYTSKNVTGGTPIISYSHLDVIKDITSLSDQEFVTKLNAEDAPTPPTNDVFRKTAFSQLHAGCVYEKSSLSKLCDAIIYKAMLEKPLDPNEHNSFQRNCRIIQQAPGICDVLKMDNDTKEVFKNLAGTKSQSICK